MEAKLERLEMLLKGIARDAQGCEDYQAGDSIGRTAQAALELIDDLQLSLEPETVLELAA